MRRHKLRKPSYLNNLCVLSYRFKCVVFEQGLSPVTSGFSIYWSGWAWHILLFLTFLCLLLLINNYVK